METIYVPLDESTTLRRYVYDDDRGDTLSVTAEFVALDGQAPPDWLPWAKLTVNEQEDTGSRLRVAVDFWVNSWAAAQRDYSQLVFEIRASDGITEVSQQYEVNFSSTLETDTWFAYGRSRASSSITGSASITRWASGRSVKSVSSVTGFRPEVTERYLSGRIDATSSITGAAHVTRWAKGRIDAVSRIEGELTRNTFANLLFAEDFVAEEDCSMPLGMGIVVRVLDEQPIQWGGDEVVIGRDLCPEPPGRAVTEAFAIKNVMGQEDIYRFDYRGTQIGRIIWTTTQPGTKYIEYGRTPSVEDFEEEHLTQTYGPINVREKYHEEFLLRLQPDALYAFRVTSVNEDGHSLTSDVYFFRTSEFIILRLLLVASSELSRISEEDVIVLSTGGSLSVASSSGQELVSYQILQTSANLESLTINQDLIVAETIQQTVTYGLV